jgi:hypothetical protein
MATRIVPFISRTEQLRLRGNRNFGRYKRLTHGLVEPDGPERRQWQQESAAEDVRDAEWNQRHGRIEGGADILRFKQVAEQAETNGDELRMESSQLTPSG